MLFLIFFCENFMFFALFFDLVVHFDPKFAQKVVFSKILPAPDFTHLPARIEGCPFL